MFASIDRRLCYGGFCLLISPQLNPASALLPKFEFWMGDRGCKMWQRGERWRSVIAVWFKAKIENAIPVGQARFGGSRKQATQKVMFVGAVEMTSFTTDLEHITCFASGNQLALAIDRFPLFPGYQVHLIQTSIWSKLSATLSWSWKLSKTSSLKPGSCSCGVMRKYQNYPAWVDKNCIYMCSDEMWSFGSNQEL